MEPVETARVFSNRYELTHLIARGGMAQVYRARDRELDRPVALKVLFPELSVDRAFVERFRREAQAAANLSHPNIVPVYDWGSDDGAYFIVMEYIDGRALSALLRESGPLPPHDVATIGANVAAALSFAHRHGVVHRDVKPGNVLITKDGGVKVTDFGIARAMNTEESLTQTGAVMGTAAYFSPEQAEGHGVDARSDIYSLGVVLYEMSTGKPPFTGDSPVSVASKHVRDQPVLPRQINPAMPVELERVVMKAMAKSPDDRYATADEFRADLLRFAQGTPVAAGDPALTGVMGAVGTTSVVAAAGQTRAVPVTGTAATPTKAEEERKKRTRRLVIVLVTLLVVLAVIAYFLLRSIGVIGGSQVAVPDVAGQTVAVATTTLQDHGLDVGTKSTVLSSQPAGTVVSTKPPGGANADKNSAVDLIVSAGVGISVPNVVGDQFTTATQKLQGDGLSYKPTYVSSTRPPGTVLTQSPAAQTRVKANTVIRLTVSGTQSSATVPNIVGQTSASAGSTLQSYNLTVGNQSYVCATANSGLVVSQSPTAGVQVQPDAPVSMDISTGPCPTTTTSPPSTTTTSPPSTTTTTTPATTTTTTTPPH